MRSLARASRSRGNLGQALPQPIQAIRDLGFVQRSGQLSLLVAAPGVGKSAVALYYVLKAGIPALYISADTDNTDQSERAMALLGGVSIDQVKDHPDKYTHHLREIPKVIGFEFDSEPEADEILDMAKAYKLVQGFYPELIVVDTIGKIWSQLEGEDHRNKEAVKQCQDIARITGAHVWALHHATKSYDSGNVPIPLSGLMSGVSKIPEQCLSMWNDGGSNVCFSPVKNRSGPSDATAMNLRSWCKMSIERMLIEPIKPTVFDYDSDVELQ